MLQMEQLDLFMPPPENSVTYRIEIIENIITSCINYLSTLSYDELMEFYWKHINQKGEWMIMKKKKKKGGSCR